jgi:hypothetical protein
MEEEARCTVELHRHRRFVTLAWMLALVLTMVSQIAKREPPDFCYLLRSLLLCTVHVPHTHTPNDHSGPAYILRVHGEVCGGSHGFVLYTLQRQTTTSSIFCDSVAAAQVPSYNGSWFVLWRARKSMWILSSRYLKESSDDSCIVLR